MSLDRARRLIEAGRPDDAARLYHQLCADPALRAPSFYGLGFIAWRSRDLDAARDWFVKCLKEDPDHLNARYYLGGIAARQGDVDNAVRRWAEVLARDPGHAGALAGIRNAHSSTPPPAPPPAAPPSAPPAAAPPPGPAGSVGVAPSPSSPRSVVGRVRSVRQQSVSFNGTPAVKQLLTFRVDVPDEHGNLERSIGVELRAFRISGGVEDGDWVEIEHISRSGTVKRLQNLTTGQCVRTGLFS